MSAEAVNHIDVFYCWTRACCPPMPANSDLHCFCASILVLDALALCAAAFIYPLKSLNNDSFILGSPRFNIPHSSYLYDSMSSTPLMEFSQFPSRMDFQTDWPVQMLIRIRLYAGYHSSPTAALPTNPQNHSPILDLLWDFSLACTHCLILFRVHRLIKLEFTPSFIITSFRVRQIKWIQRSELNACLSQWPYQVECTLR
jgi:hypothetical protein